MTHNGQIYEFREVRLEDAPPTRKAVTKSASHEVTSEDQKAALALFEDFLGYEENGFTGRLKLDRDTLAIKKGDEKEQSQTIEEIHDYSGLNRNDPALLPKTVVSGGSTLTLAAIKWTLASEREDSTALYDAALTYTGMTKASAAAYTATAAYSGFVETANPDRVRYAVIYEPKAHESAVSESGSQAPVSKPMEAVVTSEAESIPETPTAEQSEKKSGNRWYLVVLLGIILLGGMGGAIVIGSARLTKSRQKQLSGKGSGGWEDEEAFTPESGMRVPEAMRYMDREIPETDDCEME